MAFGADSLEGHWGEIYQQQDKGEWIRYELPGFALADAAYLSDSQMLVAGALIDSQDGHREGAVLFSSDNGGNWSLIYRNKKVERIHTLAAANGVAYAVGETGLAVRFALP